MLIVDDREFGTVLAAVTKISPKFEIKNDPKTTVCSHNHYTYRNMFMSRMCKECKSLRPTPKDLLLQQSKDTFSSEWYVLENIPDYDPIIIT